MELRKFDLSASQDHILILLPLKEAVKIYTGPVGLGPTRRCDQRGFAARLVHNGTVAIHMIHAH